MKFDVGLTRRLLAAFCIAAACAFVCGCSSGRYPVVLNDPPPPAETTLNTDQVKQALDQLVSDRNHVCAEAVATGAAGVPPPDCGTGSAIGATPNAGAPPKP